MYIYICMYIYIVYIYSVYIYILHGFTWYVYIMYICDASIDPQMRRDMPRRIGRLIRKVLKMLQLLWLQSFHFLGDVTHQTHLAAGHQDQGDFSYPPKKNRKNTTKKYGFCRNPNQKNMGFACFFFNGEGIRVGRSNSNWA